MTEEELKQAAIAYWQDDLAKFFPKSLGPSNVEILMFKAGFDQCIKMIENSYDTHLKEFP